MDQPEESNSNPPEDGKSLFGSLAGYIQIHLDSADEWDAALEFAWAEAAAAKFKADEDLDPDEQYIRGHEQYPETEEEIAWVNAVSGMALADVPWEDDPEQPCDQ
jgi:hypothetical protein